MSSSNICVRWQSVICYLVDLKSVGIDSFGGILDLSENCLFGFDPRLPDGALFLVECSENFT